MPSQKATGLHAPQGATNSVPALEDLSVGGWKALYQAKLREPPPTKWAAEPLAIEQANPFRTETTAKGNTATRFYYDAVPGLNPKQRERWAALDTNNNGSIEIEEIVDLERETRWLKDMLPLLTAIAALLLLAVFGVSLAGAVLAQTTEISASSEFAGPLLLGTGGSVDTIAKVAEAEQDVPLALLPLCTDDQLETVQEITLSNLGDIRTGTACATCAKHYHVHVDVKMRYSESKIVVYRTGSFVSDYHMWVTIDKGFITVSRVPGQSRETVFSACASATCSQTKIAGVDVAALKAKAKKLGFVADGSCRSGT